MRAVHVPEAINLTAILRLQNAGIEVAPGERETAQPIQVRVSKLRHPMAGRSAAITASARNLDEYTARPASAFGHKSPSARQSGLYVAGAAVWLGIGHAIYHGLELRKAKAMATKRISSFRDQRVFDVRHFSDRVAFTTGVPVEPP